jgi:hypothetical protein
MKVVALNRFEYANKLRLPGEQFDTTSDKDAEILQLAQQVKIVEVETRDLKADDDGKPKPRRYQTRRMQAEE